MRKERSGAELIRGVLDGNRLALARAISYVEDDHAGAREILDALYPHTGRAHLIGVTGAPGTGKSTLVTALTRSYRERGERVAVLAVDPSSPFTGGALLGDRVRMTALSGDPGVFIRSMATRGHLGGLAAATADALLLLDAAGFERILVETVGVGQAEVEIAGTAHTTVVVEAPGLGDEVQAIKAGVMEIADIFVVNKADRPGVERTVSALEMMLEQKRGGPRTMRHHGRAMSVTLPDPAQVENGWTIPVLKSVATGGEGIPAVCERIDAHRVWLQSSGALTLRENARILYTLEKMVDAALRRRIGQTLLDARMTELVVAIRQRALGPHEAVDQIVGQIIGL
ncbi:MAG: methylmalonyl Co-A mutase-associated GTPase MeaB [Caldilineaceae bacterium]|nr:methylmalonyl Co-A mutase-associated GTPase MeaB [Caldilineaceae bacterium]